MNKKLISCETRNRKPQHRFDDRFLQKPTNQPARPTATSYQQWYSESSPLRPGARGEWPLLKQYPCSWPTHQGRKKKKDVTNGKEKQNCHSLQSARRKYKEFTDTVLLKFSEANQRSLWLSGNEVWPAVKERWETWVHSLGWEDALEKEMALHSNMLARKTLWMQKAGGLKPMRSQRAGHD